MSFSKSNLLVVVQEQIQIKRFKFNSILKQIENKI